MPYLTNSTTNNILINAYISWLYELYHFFIVEVLEGTCDLVNLIGVWLFIV